MNHNSFPSGEQESLQKNNTSEWDNLKEEVSFDNRSQEDIEADNARELARPSFKNMSEDQLADHLGLDHIPRYGAEDIKKIAEKIQNGDKLEKEDIVSLSAAYGSRFSEEEQDRLGEFLDVLGMSEGEQFDVKAPVYYTSESGRRDKQPLTISFINNHGTYTSLRIDSELDKMNQPHTRIISNESKTDHDIESFGDIASQRVFGGVHQLDGLREIRPVEKTE